MEHGRKDVLTTRIFGDDGGLVQFRIFFFLDAQSLGRCGCVSKSLAAIAREDVNWQIVLSREFDASSPREGSSRGLVKDLYKGMTRGWTGLCLDKYTSHWTPYPLSITGIVQMSCGRAAQMHAWPTLFPQPVVDDGVRRGEHAVQAFCNWRTLRDSKTRMVGGLLPRRKGLSDVEFLESEVRGRSVQWMTLTEIELVQGSNILVPNVYWGLRIGGACLGLYEHGGFFAVMDEIRTREEHRQRMQEEAAHVHACPAQAPEKRAEIAEIAGGAVAAHVLGLGESEEFVGVCTWPAKAVSGADGEPASIAFLRFCLESVREELGGITCTLRITSPSRPPSPRDMFPPAATLQEGDVHDAGEGPAALGRRAASTIEEMQGAANNLVAGEANRALSRGGLENGTSATHREMQLILRSNQEDNQEDFGSPIITLQAVEAVDEYGVRHPVGNMICGALPPVSHVQLIPPLTLFLTRHGPVLGGVLRDAFASGGVAMFVRGS